jgi:pimeloyl-ACP methyl ester carboxylesterase
MTLCRHIQNTIPIGARIIAVDRCGYGLSSPSPRRTYKSFAEDIDCLVEHLQLDRFCVVGYSSGGPHALACALQSKHLSKLGSLALVSSDAPYGLLGGNWVRHMYGCDEETMAQVDEWMTNPHVLQQKEKEATELRKSYESMSKLHRREIALADLSHSTATGLVGAASDAVLEAEAGGWSSLGPLDAVRARCNVTMWHGDEDTDVSIDAGRALHQLLSADNNGASSEGQTVAFETIAGENHTLIRRHWSSILIRAIHEAQQTVGDRGPGVFKAGKLPAPNL